MNAALFNLNISQLHIVEPSHPVLSQKAEEIKKSDVTSERVQELIKKMLEIAGGERGTIEKKRLVGLAAPQIGALVRIIVVDPGANGKGQLTELKVYINPVIKEKSEEQTEWYEGCFSTGCVTGIVKRAQRIRVLALNEKGEEVDETHINYAARIFQHEIDHLDGKRFPSLIDNPDHLHWVEKDQFVQYRNQEGWRNWPHKCSKEKWEAIQKGLSVH